MARKKITKQTVDSSLAHPPKPGERVETLDTLLPGLRLRVSSSTRNPKGRAVWSVVYWYGPKETRKQKRHNLGQYPAMSLADARKAAGAALNDVADGIDPAAKRRERREHEPDTVAAVIEEFMKRHGKKRRTWRVVQRIFDKDVIPVLGKRDIKTVTRRDVRELIDGIVDRGAPIMANRTLAHMRKLFNWAVDEEIIDATPITRMKPPGKETARDRTLDDEELKAVWNACEHLGYPFGPYVRLLMVTAQRREEVASMKWSTLDLDAKAWELAADETKSGRAHVVPLSDLAVDILKLLPRIKDGDKERDHIFTSGRTGDSRISGYAKAKKRLDKYCTVAGWTFHDLRRTATTEMARLRVPTDILGRVLNHAAKGVTNVHYNKYEYLDEKRHALDTWAAKLADTIKGKGDDGKVVQLHG